MTNLVPGAIEAPLVARSTMLPAHDVTLAFWPRSDWSAIARALRARPAAYLLLDAIGDDRMIRVGETHAIAERLAAHRHDHSLQWADCAVAMYGPRIDKQMAVALQYTAETFIRDRTDTKLIVGAPAVTPRIRDDEWQEVKRLFEHVLAALPRVGVVLVPEPPPRRHPEGVLLLDRSLDVSEVNSVYEFNARGFRAAAAIVGPDVFVLAGSEIRARPPECARPSHKAIRTELVRRGRIAESIVPGRVRITSPLRVSSLDAAGKCIVGDRHVYSDCWLPCELNQLPEVYLGRLTDEVGKLADGRRI